MKSDFLQQHEILFTPLAAQVVGRILFPFRHGLPQNWMLIIYLSQEEKKSKLFSHDGTFSIALGASRKPFLATRNQTKTLIYIFYSNCIGNCDSLSLQSRHCWLWVEMGQGLLSLSLSLALRVFLSPCSWSHQPFFGGLGLSVLQALLEGLCPSLTWSNITANYGNTNFPLLQFPRLPRLSSLRCSTFYSHFLFI